MEKQLQRLQFSDLRLKTFDQWIPAYRAAEIRVDIDTGYSSSGNQLPGRRTETQQLEAEDLKAAIASLMSPVNWTMEDTVSARILSHSTALKSGNEIIDSLQNRRARSRVSHLVKITYTLRSQSQGTFIGRVEGFL